MSTKVSLENSIVNRRLKTKIIIDDSSLVGKTAYFKVFLEVKVIDSRPINKNKVFFEKKFKINNNYFNFEVDLDKCQHYGYDGKKIEINLMTEVVVDDAIFFDTKVSKEIESNLWKKPIIKVKSKQMIDPKDKFNLMDNIKAIPNDAKVAVFGLSIAGLIIIAINTLLGIHDQFSPEQATLFYSHYNSDGEGNSPLVNALMGSGAMGAGVWYMMKKQLRKYMTFFYKKIKFNGLKTEKFRIRDLVGGTSRVDLKNVELKVVACNMEKGQYTRGSGSNKRTVSFSEPFNAISLYDQKIDFIPMNTEISEYFKGDISFEEMYKVLYPEQMLGDNHGLKMHWEVQLIHNKFIDQELIGDSNKFKFENFLKG